MKKKKKKKIQKKKKDKPKNKSNEIKMKKTRWSKKVKNALMNLKVFYQNVKGLKSRMETISDFQPMLICSVETHLQKKEENRIPGYIARV